MDEDSEAVTHIRGLIEVAVKELREVQSEEAHAEANFHMQQERYVDTCAKLKKEKQELGRLIAEHRGIIYILGK